MNKIAEFIKTNRKENVRMDKVNETLAMFGMEAVPGRKDN